MIIPVILRRIGFNYAESTKLLQLSRKAASATAGLHGIWILEGEPALLKTAVKVDLGPVQKQVALLVHYDTYSVEFGDDVTGFVEGIGEVKRVLKTAASTAYDADADVL